MPTRCEERGPRLLGVGCDTEERARLERVLARRPGFLHRWFHEDERRAVAAADDGLGLALRLFCLKESAVKALWPVLRLGPAEVRALPRAEGFVLDLPGLPGARLELEGAAGVDGTHAWATVLAFQATETRAAGS